MIEGLGTFVEQQAIAKLQLIKQLADQNGLFKIVAIDHRDVYADIFTQNTGLMPDYGQLIGSKREIVRDLSGYASAFLLDPVYSVPELVRDGSIGKCGFIVSIEGNDYATMNFKDYLYKDTDVWKIKEMGASAVKLFLYYSMEPSVSAVQDALIEELSVQCRQGDIPFLLEPILCADENPGMEQSVERTRAMLQRLSRFDIDLFKIVFPGDIMTLSDRENMEICEYVLQDIRRPWIILSSGIDRSAFFKQLELSCRCGASGFAIGRTLWSDCVGICKESQPERYREMISTFQTASHIATQYGANWESQYLI